VVRSGWRNPAWRNPAWRDRAGERFDMTPALHENAEPGLIDQPIWLPRRGEAPPPVLRPVALKKAPQAAQAAHRTARRKKPAPAQAGGGHQLAQATLVAADWVILVTALPPDTVAAADILARCRLRWRSERAFKRLKTLIGLKPPPGTNPRSARPDGLAHRPIILLLEPRLNARAGSPCPMAA
jgi:hypothetical protein